MTARPARPYSAAVDAYLRAGWPSVLPLPAGAKWPPPPGWTGHRGGWPNLAQVADWKVERPAANVALRLPPSVVGLDIDAYKTAGARSLARLVAECGPLPATWTSTSRDDGASGIRLYRVPTGVRWGERRAGPGIEIIHVGHRYAVVWPSIHPEGGTYRWIAPDGRIADRVPLVGELPWLPPWWGRRVSEPPAPPPRTVAPMQRRRAVGGLSPYAAATLAGTLADLRAMRRGDRRNDALNRAAYKLGGLVAAGELDERTVREELLAAAHDNGYAAQDGERATLATIEAGLRSGKTRPYAGATPGQPRFGALRSVAVRGVAR